MDKLIIEFFLICYRIHHQKNQLSILNSSLKINVFLIPPLTDGQTDARAASLLKKKSRAFNKFVCVYKKGGGIVVSGRD